MTRADLTWSGSRLRVTGKRDELLFRDERVRYSAGIIEGRINIRTRTHAHTHARTHAHTYSHNKHRNMFFRMIYNPLGFYQKFVYMYLLLCEFAIKRKAVFCVYRKSQLGERLTRSWHINLERFRYRLRQYCNEICRPLLSHSKNRIMLRVKLKLCRIRDAYPGAFGVVRAPIRSTETLKA